jgi:hypothetical protein
VKWQLDERYEVVTKEQARAQAEVLAESVRRNERRSKGSLGRAVAATEKREAYKPRPEVGAAASRGVFTLHSNVTDADDRERVIREAQTAGTDGPLCSRCALRPVAVSA